MRQNADGFRVVFIICNFIWATIQKSLWKICVVLKRTVYSSVSACSSQMDPYGMDSSWSNFLSNLWLDSSTSVNRQWDMSTFWLRASKFICIDVTVVPISAIAEIIESSSLEVSLGSTGVQGEVCGRVGAVGCRPRLITDVLVLDGDELVWSLQTDRASAACPISIWSLSMVGESAVGFLWLTFPRCHHNDEGIEVLVPVSLVSGRVWQRTDFGCYVDSLVHNRAPADNNSDSIVCMFCGQGPWRHCW